MIITALGFVPGMFCFRRALGPLFIPPGYYASILLIEKLGRKWIQIQGFLLEALFRMSFRHGCLVTEAYVLNSRHSRRKVPQLEQDRVHRVLYASAGLPFLPLFWPTSLTVR